MPMRSVAKPARSTKTAGYKRHPASRDLEIMTDPIDNSAAAAAVLELQSNALRVRIADLAARSNRHRAQEPTRVRSTLSGRRQWARWAHAHAEIGAEGARYKAELAQLEQQLLVSCQIIQRAARYPFRSRVGGAATTSR
jgi:hypothetical protein